MVDLEKLRKKIGMEEKFIGREKYFNSSVIALIVENRSGYHFLFQKRAKNIRQGGEISFPGGRIEERDKNSLETALRECHEEIGLEQSSIDVLGKIGTHLLPSGVLVEAYLGMVKLENVDELKLNREEVESCFLVPLKFFLDEKPRVEKLQVETQPYYEENGKIYIFPYEELDLPERYRKPWKSPPREVYFYKYGNEIIWGITADIIFEAIKYMKK